RSQHRDPLLRHLTSTIVALARHYCPPTGATRLIDVGCGVGRTSFALAEAGYRVTGVDPSARAIELAREDAGTVAVPAAQPAFAVGEATAAAPEAWHGSFDVAVCSEVIEHVTEPAAVVAYCRDVLRPGGLLVLTTPHDRAQWTVMDDYAGHVTRFSPAEIEG